MTCSVNLLDLKSMAIAQNLQLPPNITKRELCELVNQQSTLPPPPSVKKNVTARKKWNVEIAKAYPDWYYKGEQRPNNAKILSTLPIANLFTLEKLINDGKYDPSRVWIAFDYDATLTEKDEHGEMQFRGGEESKQVLQRLKDNGVHFLLLTAAVKSGTPNAFQVITDEMKHLGIEQFFDHQNSKVKKADEQEWFIKGPLTSAALFAKGGLFRHYISFEQQFGNPDNQEPKPQLLIFVDDSGNNILTLLDELKKMPFDVDIVAAHYQPVPGKTSGAGVDATSKEIAQQIFDKIDPTLAPLAEYNNYPPDWHSQK